MWTEKGEKREGERERGEREKAAKKEREERGREKNLFQTLFIFNCKHMRRMWRDEIGGVKQTVQTFERERGEPGMR